MQLTLAFTLLACVASVSSQDDSRLKHAHHRRADEHTTLIPQSAKAEPTIHVDADTLAAAAKSATDAHTDSIAKSATAATAGQTEAITDPEGNDEALNATNGTDADAAKLDDLNLNLKAKASSGAGSNPHPTHKTDLPPATATGQPYLSQAHLAIARMQTFYNRPRPGQWSEGWWNGANAFTLLADLRSRDSSTFIKKITDGSNGVFAHTVSTSNKNKYGGMAYDDWYDDMMWWTVGLIKAYDVTGNKLFLSTARGTWQRVQNEARHAVCGGLYNAMQGVKGRGQSTIATLLYVEVTALFATRYPREKSQFLALSKAQWKWVMSNIYQFDYIRGDGQKKGPGGTCTNNGAILSYIEGTAINAAVALNAATGDYSYIDTANTIATKSLQDKGLNRNGILHDTCDIKMGCNQDEAQFKGIFMRGLRNLYDIQPSAAGGQIPTFLKANADSIWAKTRNKNNLLGQNWSGPYNPTSNAAMSFAQHSSATMALVAAAML